MRILQPAIDQYRASGGVADPYAVGFNNVSTSIDCGGDASLVNIHHNLMTVEAWIKDDSLGTATDRLVTKRPGGGSGWTILNYGGNGFYVAVDCVTADGIAQTGVLGSTTDGLWHHIAFTWDNSSYNTPRIWIDGTEHTTVVTNRNGAAKDDTAGNLYIGNRLAGDRTFDGEIAWVRISDNIRWTSSFTPDGRDTPPAVDVNTVEQWNLNDGSGATAKAEVSSPTNDGAITDGTWIPL